MKTFLSGLLILIIGAALYGKLCEKVFGPDDRKTPAFTKQDGVDYIPMKGWKNSLINLLNIAGTGPIFGPIQGILFGPLAFITIPIGNIIGGAMHDYFSGMICLRDGGSQMSETVRRYSNRGVFSVYQVFCSVLLLLVGAVFIYTPGDIAATQVFGFDGKATSVSTWVIYGAIFAYYLAATVFPIDKIIGRVYPIFGAVLLFSAVGIFIGMFGKGYPLTELWGSWEAPLAYVVKDGAQTSFSYADYFTAERFFPTFFITVACGILSGFHSTQTAIISRTMKSERQGRMTFYNMMVLEGFIAMVWAAAAMGVYNLGLQAADANLYSSTVGIVCRDILGNVGGVAALLGIIILPITSGDTALRGLRLAIAESLHLDQSSGKKRMALSGMIFALVAVILVFAKVSPDGFKILWRYFAWSNQTLSLFAFLVISVWMFENGKQRFVWMPLIPGTFYAFATVTYDAAVEQVQDETSKWTYTAAVPAGMYNLDVKATEVGETGKTITVTALVDLSEQDRKKDIQLPDGLKNSVVEPAGDVHAIVGGLDEIAAASSEDGEVEVKFSVSALGASSVPADDKTAIESLVAQTAPGSTLEYFDFALTKTVDGHPMQNFGSSNDKLITILIPYDLTGRDHANISIYRCHGGRTEALGRDPAAGVEGFCVGENCLIVCAKTFSTYAVAYSDTTSLPIDPLPTPGYSEDDSAPTYKVELPDSTTGGVIAARPKWAEAGDTVTLAVTPEDGFILSALDVTDARGNKIEVTDKGDGTYTFRMPSRKVSVTATFAPDGSYSTCSGDHTCPIWPYADTEPTAWYHDGVHYIIEKGLMTGYGNGIFKPNMDTSRAMIAVMLWRLEGSPVVSYLLDFEDVKAEAWYTEAIRWAKSEGIIGGYGNGCWGPDDAMTREQMVTILWRYAQYKGYDVSVGEDTNILSYDDAFDVAEYAIPAMQWACGSGMVQGMNDPDGEGMILDPESKGTRAQVATMLMRFCDEMINGGQ